MLCPKWQTNDSCPKCFKLSLRVRFERDILTKTLEDELLDLVEQVWKSDLVASFGSVSKKGYEKDFLLSEKTIVCSGEQPV